VDKLSFAGKGSTASYMYNSRILKISVYADLLFLYALTLYVTSGSKSRFPLTRQIYSYILYFALDGESSAPTGRIKLVRISRSKCRIITITYTISRKGCIKRSSLYLAKRTNFPYRPINSGQQCISKKTKSQFPRDCSSVLD